MAAATPDVSSRVWILEAEGVPSTSEGNSQKLGCVAAAEGSTLTVSECFEILRGTVQVNRWPAGHGRRMPMPVQRATRIETVRSARIVTLFPPQARLLLPKVALPQY